MINNEVKEELKRKIENGYSPNRYVNNRIASIKNYQHLETFMIVFSDVFLDDLDGNYCCKNLEAVVSNKDYERILDRFIQQGYAEEEINALMHIDCEDKYSEGGAGPEDKTDEILCGKIKITLSGDLSNPELYIAKL